MGRTTKLEFWRSFFRDSEHDLWTIIDKALTIAALDFPEQLRVKRDAFAEKLFSSTGPELWEEGGSVCRSQGEATTINEEELEYADDLGSGSRDEASSSEERQVLEIKQLLLDEDKSDEDILEGLNKLSKMQLSIETLKSTSIGRPVNHLRKHPSAVIKSMAKQIIRSWKAVADEWAKSSDDVQGRLNNSSQLHSNDSSSVNDPVSAEANEDLNCGLPAPPIDEGELLAALDMPQTMQLMDFMNNGMASGDMDNSPLVQVSYTSSRASHSPAGISPYNNSAREIKSRTSTAFNDNATNVNHSHRKERFQQKPAEASKRTENLSQKASTEEYSIKDRLAAAKRKLQEGYQQAETAKKQRVVQVMGLEELPRGTGPKAMKRGVPGHGTTNFLRNNYNASGIHRR